MTMTNEAKLPSHPRAARGKSPRVHVLDIADAVLKSAMRLPPLPKLAEEWSQAMAAKEHDEGKAGARATQWGRWYYAVRTELDRDGVKLLAELETLAPDEHTRFDRIAERVVSMLRALRELNLPWWPSHTLDTNVRRELTLLEYVERELGRLETRQIRRGVGRPSLFDATHGLPMRRDVDDWAPMPSMDTLL